MTVLAVVNLLQVRSQRSFHMCYSYLAPDAYDRAMSSGLLQSDVEKIVPVALAYASWAVRTLYSDGSGEAMDDFLRNAIKALEDAVESVHKSNSICRSSSLHRFNSPHIAIIVSKAGDPKFRLEKMLAGIVSPSCLHVHSILIAWAQHIHFNNPIDNGVRAAQVWQVASENYRSSYVPWLKYTDALMFAVVYFLD